MDAKCKERRRDQEISRREKRWSMNSQRLEEIVAELMKPISDARRSFDTDLSALLEEYLTEAGLHALALEEGGGEEGAGVRAAPNFAELALLLQQSASIYGRKVDFLYQHVLNVSDSLHNSTQESVSSASVEARVDVDAVEMGVATPGGSRRKRKQSSSGEFGHIALEWASGARRAGEVSRPPPTLPRMYLELEPRLMTDADAPLLDYNAEPVGLLADFHVAWRLHDGLLVDELEGTSGTTGASLRPISLMELQAAIEAAAPPSPPPSPPHSPLHSPPHSPPHSPLHSPPHSPPHSPHYLDPLHASTPLPVPAMDDKCAVIKKERKRRSDVKIDDIVGGRIKLLIGEDLRREMSVVREFSLSSALIQSVMTRRKASILAHRRRLRDQPGEPDSDFHGYDLTDIGGFPGWSAHDALAASTSLSAPQTLTAESDDDGFFEQSSVGDSDASRTDDSTHIHTVQSQSQCQPVADGGGGGGDGSPGVGAGEAEWWSWRARVVARAAAAEARGGVDVRALADAVLGAAPEGPPHTAFTHILATTAKEETDVSRLLLATLFLANAGNVEIVPGPPLSVDSFSVRVLSRDRRLYCAAAAAAAAAADVRVDEDTTAR